MTPTPTLRRCLVITLAGALFVGVASATAQTIGATTGALNGRVTDKTGGVLPGVAVVASSPAMLGSRQTLTDTGGRYEIPAVPPGEYSLKFSLPGFDGKVRPGIQVTLGGTTTVDDVLDVAKQQEHVVVDGKSPVVDRSGTALAHSLGRRQLADLPASRTLNAIIDATPGMQLTRFEVGGGSAGLGSGFFAYGTIGLSQLTLEGILIVRIGPNGFTFDYGSFEHSSVSLGAHGPEWPFSGVVLQLVTKSGGNEPSGSVYVDAAPRAWQAFNIDGDQITRGLRGRNEVADHEVNRQWGARDANVDAGGAIRRDRLWWYVSARDQELSVRQVRFPIMPARTHITNLGGKATARVTGNSRLVLFGQASRNHQPTRVDGYELPMAAVNREQDSTSNQLAPGGVWKVEWNAYAGQKVYVELLGGQFLADRHERPNGTDPRREDSGDLSVVGGSRNWEERWRSSQVSASVSYLTTGRTGSHHLKLRGEYRHLLMEEEWHDGYAGGVLSVTQGGAPVSVYLFETPSKSVGGQHWYAASASDSWQLGGRLTLNIGARFDRYRVFFPAQRHPASRAGDREWDATLFPAVDNVADWNVVSPRLGLTHTVTSDGRTVVKLTYGKSWFPPGTELIFGANPNSRTWFKQYGWQDTNGNLYWDSGEEQEHDLRAQGGGARSESLDRHASLGFVREATARIEREIAPNTGLETGLIWREDRSRPFRQDATQPFDAFTRTVTVTDPGVNGVPGPRIVLYDLPAKRDPSYVVSNAPNDRNEYFTWEINARRRMHRGWSLVAGFSHTWVREFARGYFGQIVRANVYPLTPNDLINTAEGGRHEFRIWSARVFGTYEGPFGLRITPYLRHQSGQPYGRTFSVRTGLNIGSLTVLAEPIGTRRMDHVTLFDMRVEKGFVLGAGRRLSAFIDGFNLLNANPEQNINWGSAVFRRPLAVVPPRIARIGAKYDW